jgi:hypothetical protein
MAACYRKSDVDDRSSRDKSTLDFSVGITDGGRISIRAVLGGEDIYLVDRNQLLLLLNDAT